MAAGALAALVALSALSCRTTGAAAGTVPVAVDSGFAEVAAGEWVLARMWTADGVVGIDGAARGDAFSLGFEGGLAVGTAMPNTFRSPFSLGADRSITFGPMATTRMAPMGLEEIDEHGFFEFLYNVFAWDLADGFLELHTTDESGNVVVLVFAGR